MDQNILKKQAAERAVKEVKSGMVVGLGSGSTMQFALEKLAEEIKKGGLYNIVGIPSSKNTEDEAVRLGIPLTTLNIQPVIDLTIDGADEADEKMNLIKGGGGALLREKVVIQASKRVVIMIDESKLSKFLGEKFYVPIEVLSYALKVEENFIQSLGAKTTVRKKTGDKPYITDEGNIILDSKFEAIKDPDELSRKIEMRAGIVEHGIFSSSLIEKIIVAGKNGVQEITH